MSSKTTSINETLNSAGKFIVGKAGKPLYVAGVIKT